MKKIFAILFASLIILSGMHFSIAQHICGGTVASVKWSFSGQAATCGMESPVKKDQSHKGFSSNCCQNNINLLTVDKNYNPTSFQIKEVSKQTLPNYFSPVINLFHPANLLYTSIKYSSPPYKLSASVVNLADICVFLI
jgi:hypothetical protein